LKPVNDARNNFDIDSLRVASEHGDCDASVRLGQLLLQRGGFGSSEFDEAITRLEQAAGMDHTEAQLLLANVLAQVHALPDADARAAHWYDAVAQKNHPEALARLGDMYLTGRGVAADDAQALACIERAARQCYPQLQCDLAYMLDHGIGCNADPVAATSWFLRALAQGSHQAAFSLGLRYHCGRGVGRDAAVAQAMFECAAGGDFPDACVWRDRLDEITSSNEKCDAGLLAQRIRDQVRSLPHQFAAAGISELDSGESATRKMTAVIERHWSALDDRRISLDPGHRSARGNATGWPVIAAPGLPQLEIWQPRVFRIPHFLSEYERAHVIALSAPRMAAAADFSRDAAEFEKDFFTGTAARLGAHMCDPVIRNIERRIADAAMLPARHIEPLSVLRYQDDDVYEAHVDYLTPDRLEGAHGGQRLVTFICYLRAPREGGETEYLNAEHAVAGEPGLALLHYNCLPDGQPDEMSLHASRPVIAGEKWLLRTAIHAQSLYEPIAAARDAT